MLKIKKYKVNDYDCFDICTNEGIFQIWFCRNLDLYWIYNHKERIFHTEDSKSFYITKENYFLFNLFDELYEDVSNYNIFVPNDITNKDDCSMSNEWFKEVDCSNTMKLFKNDRIEWHCDNFEYENSSSFVIEKLDDCYKVTFNKSKDINYVSYSVRIRNSGSRYVYFNMIFMRMYHKLCEYNPELHQIHIEEYLYNKRLIKRKETL